MRIARVAVVASFMLSALILSWAFFSAAAVRGEFLRAPIGTVAVFAGSLLVCSWPWFDAFSATKNTQKTWPMLSFSVASVAIVAAFASPISAAPMEGVGWNVILCVALVWVAYALISRLGREKKK